MTIDLDPVFPAAEPEDVVTGPDPRYEEFRLDAVTAYRTTCKCDQTVLSESQEEAVMSMREHIEMAHPAWYNLDIRCNEASPFPVDHFRCGRRKGHEGNHAGTGMFGNWHGWKP